MSYLKFTPYIYLVFGIYLIYDGFTKINSLTYLKNERTKFTAASSLLNKSGFITPPGRTKAS